MNTTGEYEGELRDRLLAGGFREDTDSEVICRWRLGPVKVDIMPTDSRPLGFTNPWYKRALDTAKSLELPPDAQGGISIRVVTAPVFCATKLVAWEGRGKGDLLHQDIEDIVAVVNGRPELLGEIESETPDLRVYLSKAITRIFEVGLADQLAGHLASDSASQARLKLVVTTLRRIERNPRIVTTGQLLTADSCGDPGATHVPRGATWEWEILGIEKAVASKAPAGSSHVAVLARLTSRSQTAGIAGDGRSVFVEDSYGRRFPPLYKLLHAERLRRNMPGPYDQILPDTPFDTVWVYEFPLTAKGLRLLLPFDHTEIPFQRPA